MAVVLRELCVWVLVVAAVGSGQKLLSDFKRCQDEECSMLMCRGKALRDFVGPDCRFLKFKAGETIYVYYKLAGKRNDIWAGSVGSQFGYFPKDLIEINLVYSTTEVELPSEDTDFVCFNEGPDDFDDVEIGELVGALSEEHVVLGGAAQLVPSDESEKTLGMAGNKARAEEAGEREEKVQPAEQGAGSPLTWAEGREAESPASSKESFHIEEPVESAVEEGGDISSLEDRSTEGGDSSHVKVSTQLESNPQEPETLSPKEAGSKGLSQGSSVIWGSLVITELGSQEGEQSLLELEDSSQLETGFGSTQDAIVVDDEVTHNIAVLDKDLEFEVELKKEDVELLKRTPLISYSGNGSIPEQDLVQDNATAEDYHSEPSEANAKTTPGAIDTLEVPKKGWSLDGEIEDTAKSEETPMSESGGLQTTLGETFSADINGNKTMSQVTNLDGPDSEGLAKDVRDGRSEHSVEEGEGSPSIAVETGVGVKESSWLGTEGSEATVPALAPSSEAETHRETVAGNEGNEKEQLIRSKVESHVSGQEGKSQTKSSTFNKEVTDGFVATAERDENHQEVVQRSDAEPAVEPNRDPPQLVRMEPGTGSSAFASTEGIDVTEGSKSEAGTRDGFPTGYVNTMLPEGTVEAEGQTNSVQGGPDPGDHKAAKGGDQLGRNDQGDVDEPPESYSKLAGDSVSEEGPGEADDESLDEPEELLEDENAADARAARDDEASASQEGRSDEQELDVDDVNITEESNNVETEDLQDAMGGLNFSAAEKDREVEMENIRGQTNWIESQKESHSPSLRSVDAHDLRAEREGGPQTPKHFLGVQHKERSEFAQEGEARGSGADSMRGNASNPSEDSANKTEDIRLPSNENGADNASRRFANLKHQEAVEKLTILKGSLAATSLALVRKYLSPQQVLEIEANLHSMETKLKLAMSTRSDEQSMESVLDNILEDWETRILEMVESMLDDRAEENQENNEETMLVNDLQELVYQLRMKYSDSEESVAFDSGEQLSEERDYPQVESLDQGEPDEADKEVKEDSQLPGRRPLPHLAKDQSWSEGRQELGRGSPSSHERSQWLPGIILGLERAVLASSNILRPVARLLSQALVSSLPEEMQPGPAFHGLPWEPILITAALGFLSSFIFMWRTCLSVKSRRYQITEKQLAEKIKQLIQEKVEALENVSSYEKKLEETKALINEAQNVKSTASVDIKELEESCRELEQVNLHLENRVKSLQASLEKEKAETTKQQTVIADSQKSVAKLQKVISAHTAELSQVQEVLRVAKANEEKMQVDLQSVLEENARLTQSKSQLLLEAEGWSERHSELTEQIKFCQKAQRDLEETLAYKDNEIEVLTDCVMQLRQLDAESDGENNGWDKEVDGEVANGELPDKNKRMKIQKMMDVSRVKTTLKIIEEEKDHFQSKLIDEIKARHELEEQIKQLEHNFAATTTEKSRLENEFKTMQQKLEILTELYHQKEMALQKKLTQEECQRQEKELKLSVADEKALQALEEVKMYKQRIQEMEEELLKTERSFKNQIAAHEKKAHENWLSARSAERTLTVEKRETANLRQKMIELNQKLSQVQRPSIIKPMPGRPDRQVPPGAPPPLGPARRAPVSRDDSYGPSPVSMGPPSPPMIMEHLVRPPSVNAGRGFPRDRGDGGHRVPPSALPSREWVGPGPDRMGPSSDHGSPPLQWDWRPGPMDGYPAPWRPPSETGMMSGRISGPGEIRGLPPPNRAEMGSGGPGQLPSGPRTSSPIVTECAAQVNVSASLSTPSFPGAPIMNSPMAGMPPPGPRHGLPPPRGTYGPGPLPQNHPVRVPALRDYPPAPFPAPGHRPFLPGPLLPPHPLRDFPPGAREYPRGPRSLPPEPTPLSGAHELPPGPDNRQ
ncbi:transport and Golgi organization protein 1 homolog isoform X7 [Narcine bancroftii]|uniref:transport and Golgi organization protein 1 homolog isoform X7 n=1 Tax=Narcine bancroftii TaxID=1343680 RepID=UPI003831180D